jgi:hypothetical protein
MKAVLGIANMVNLGHARGFRNGARRRRADRRPVWTAAPGHDGCQAPAFGVSVPAMMRYFDITDHARLPQRFSRDARSILSHLG